jgi:tetratricopeptide (TPR) repeat protein
MFDATSTLCPNCHRRARRVSAAGRALLVLVGISALGAVAATVGYIATRERPYDWGMRAPRVRFLVAELEREPCDRQKIVDLGETLNAAGDFRGALRHVRTFIDRCGPLPRLLWVSYGAHEHLSEHRMAVEDASQLIESNPADKDFWWWRGMAYEQAGELERAARDYARAIELQPGLGNIPFNLADLYERMHRPCDAALALQGFIDHHRQFVTDQTLGERLNRLRLEGDCPPAVTLGDFPTATKLRDLKDPFADRKLRELKDPLTGLGQ